MHAVKKSRGQCIAVFALNLPTRTDKTDMLVADMLLANDRPITHQPAVKSMTTSLSPDAALRAPNSAMSLRNLTMVIIVFWLELEVVCCFAVQNVMTTLTRLNRLLFHYLSA